MYAEYQPVHHIPPYHYHRHSGAHDQRTNDPDDRAGNSAGVLDFSVELLKLFCFICFPGDVLAADLLCFFLSRSSGV